MPYSEIASAAGSGIAAGIEASGQNSAANTDTNYLNLAIEAQKNGYQNTSQILSPYAQQGQNDFDLYQQYLPQMMQETQMPSQAQLQQTPGYQFELSNGLQSAQNSAAARGLGVSGAAMKAASTYATGLADSTWQNVYSAQLQGEQAQSNLLLGGSQVGLSASNSLANASTTATNNESSLLSNIGSVQASGIIGAANAIGNGVQNASNSLGSGASSATGNGLQGSASSGAFG